MFLKVEPVEGGVMEPEEKDMELFRSLGLPAIGPDSDLLADRGG